MGRYTGPKTKVSRRYGVPIFGSSKALGAEKLSARHARPERLPAETVRLRDCARRKAEAPLSIRAARAAIPPHFPERAAASAV